MVEVYVADISSLSDPKESPEVMSDLWQKRKERILQYKHEKNRKQSLGAGLLLSHVLKKYGADLETLRYGENGKPETDGICFNLSHSEDLVICAVSAQPVGCDIEKISDMKKNIAERFFTINEVKYLDQFDEEEKRNEFFRLWTMKESYLKMTGEGMSLPLNMVEFVFGESVNVYREGTLCNCNIKEYEFPGYKLTVCAEDDKFAENAQYLELI